MVRSQRAGIGSDKGHVRYDPSSPENAAAAWQLLEQCYPVASARADEALSRGHEGQMSTSAIFERLAQNADEKNICGIHVYPGPKGGWHADVAFADLPPGLPNAAGTPVQLPCTTRDQALKAGGDILTAILYCMRKSRLSDTPRPETAAFIFDDVAVDLPLAFLKMIAQFQAPDREFAEARLEAIAGELGLSRPVGAEGLNALGRERMIKFYTVAAMAMVTGIVRWPRNPDEAPDDGSDRHWSQSQALTPRKR